MDKKDIPKLDKGNISAAAVINKLNISSVDKVHTTTPNEYQDIIRHNTQKIRDVDNIIDLFPDIEKMIQIVTASVLSPNNMLKVSMSYALPTIRLPEDIKNILTNIISRHIEKEYGIEKQLPTYLRESLFTKGAWASVIMSEASLDMAINGTPTDGKVNIDNYKKLAKEEKINSNGATTALSIREMMLSTENLLIDKKVFEDNKSTLNNVTTFSAEDMRLSVENDPSVIFKAIKKYTDKISQEAIDELALEGIDFTTNKDYYSKIYSMFRINDNSEYAEIYSITGEEGINRESIGTALHFNIPIESLIPIHVVNDPTKHIGYLVALDENSSPIRSSSIYNDGQMNTVMQSNMLQATETGIITRTAAALKGITGKEPTLRNIEAIYNRIVDDTIRQAIESNGINDIGMVKENADIYRVMFFRALKAKSTRLLYIPAENMAYYAFDYRDNGTGKSLIEKTAMLHSIRAILLFTKVLASIKNSTTTTKISIDIDENDTDPQGTIDMVRSEFLKTRVSTAPFGLSNINDLVYWGQSAGIIIDAKGEAAGLPNMGIEINEQGGSKVIPDDTTDEQIRSMIYLSAGLSPEIVEAGYSADYATTVHAKNLLYAKQTKQTQTALMSMTTNHVKKLAKHDASLKEKIKKVITGGLADIKKYVKAVDTDNKNAIYAGEDEISTHMKDGELIKILSNMIINDIVTELPEPETTEANVLHDAFTQFKDNLEEAVDEMFPDDVMTSDVIGELGNKGAVIKGVLKAVMIRKWMADNDYIPELTEFLVKDDKNGFVFNAFGNFTSFLKNLGDAMVPFTKELGKMVEKLDSKLGKQDDGSESSDNEYGDNPDGQNQDENTDTGEEAGSDDASDKENDFDDDFKMEDELDPDEASKDTDNGEDESNSKDTEDKPAEKEESPKDNDTDDKKEADSKDDDKEKDKK